MDFETKMAEEREYGKEQEAKQAIKASTRRERKFGIPDIKILDALVEDYREYFTRTQIEQMMKEA